MARFPKHAALVKIALAELGVRESPWGSNTGPRIREYQAATWLAGTGFPWCVAFWVWAALQAKFVLSWRGAGAYAALDWAKSVGWAVPLSGAVPGDAVVWNIGAGHLSILAEPWRPGGMVKTIDGNSSDQVISRVRNPALVRGCVHLPEKATKVTARPPMFEVVSSESGHRIIYVSGARAVGRNIARILRDNADT